MSTIAISSLRLGLVGAGTLGSEVCRLLLKRGHTQVLLVDPDTLEPHNLALSAFFQQAGAAAIGRPKVDVLCGFARPALPWQPFHGEIADLGLERLRQVDVLLSCTDSALARVETSFAARALGLPMLDAGVQSNNLPEGRVTWFAPATEAACYLCGLPEARRAELLAFAQAASLGCTQPEDNAMTGSRATVEATAAALMQVLEESTDTRPGTSFARRLRQGQPAELLQLTRSADCPGHRHPALQTLPYHQPLRALLAVDQVLELPWPICFDARCRNCGHRFAPYRRTALVRRRTPCPACLARSLDPLESLGSLTCTHPLATRSLQQLGLPAEHLYHLRSAISWKEAVCRQSDEVFF